MYNTIILKKGTESLTKKEYKEFEKGDTIWGIDQEPKEIKRWNIDDEVEAREELAKLRCYYHRGSEDYSIEEYALEFCECDEDGEFISGSDYELAEEDEV